MEDPEVAALRAQQQAAMGGMNEQAAKAQQAQQQKLQQEEMEKSILQQILEPDAYERCELASAAGLARLPYCIA